MLCLLGKWRERRSPDQTDDILPCLGDFHAANRQRYQLSPKEKGKRERERERGGQREKEREGERPGGRDAEERR